MLSILDTAYAAAEAKSKDVAGGQPSVFDMFEECERQPIPLPDVPDFADKERIAKEIEALGMPLSVLTSDPLYEAGKKLYEAGKRPWHYPS